MSGGDHGVSSEDQLFHATHIMFVFYMLPFYFMANADVHILRRLLFVSVYTLDIDTVMKADCKFQPVVQSNNLHDHFLWLSISDISQLLVASSFTTWMMMLYR